MIQDELMYKKLSGFIRDGTLGASDRTLVVCGGLYDQKVMDALGLSDYTITSLLEKEGVKKEDAERLSFTDGSFDNVIVHAGLHHCYSPHRALAEMYRVAAKNVVVFEAQDSFLMRLLTRLGLALDYETAAVATSGGIRGGVHNLPIPNYIYRWTRREVEKLVRSLDPVKEPDITFYSEFYFSRSLMDAYLKDHPLTRIIGVRAMHALIKSATILLNLFFKSQGNNFTVLIRKGGRLHGWIKETPEGYDFAL